jgi:outer membrane protein assembly factor BamB
MPRKKGRLDVKYSMTTPRARGACRLVAVTLLLAGAAAPLHAEEVDAVEARGDCPQYRCGPAHRGVNRLEEVLSPATVGGLEELWAFTIPDGSIVASAAVVDGVVYVPAGNGNGSGFLYAVNAATGDMLWRSPNIEAGVSSPAVVDGVAYLGTGIDDGFMYALSAEDGRVLWRTHVGGVSSSPTVVNGLVYIGAGLDGGTVFALDAATGDIVWSTDTIDWIHSSPAVVGGRVFIASHTATMYSLDALTGDIQWTARIGGSVPVFSSPAVANGTVYIGSTNGFTYALKAGTGDELWSRFTPIEVVSSSPAATNRTVYIGTNDHDLWALNAATGTPRWRFTTNAIINSSPTFANGVVYAADTSGFLYAVDARTGNALKTIPTGRLFTEASPVVVNGVVYIGSSLFFPELNGKLHAFGLRE